MINDEIMKQEQAQKIVDNHIIEAINETIQKELQENPEILAEAENYEKVKKELNDEPEICEFWSVSDWLYDRLKEKGEIVFECLDFKVWGRKTTGQAIALDSVIQDIAKTTY